MSAKPESTPEATPTPAWAYLTRTGLFLFFFGFLFAPDDISFPMFGQEMFLYVLMMRAGLVLVVFAISFRTFQVAARRKGLRAQKAAMAAQAATPTAQAAPTAPPVKAAVPVKKVRPQP